MSLILLFLLFMFGLPVLYLAVAWWLEGREKFFGATSFYLVATLYLLGFLVLCFPALFRDYLSTDAQASLIFVAAMFWCGALSLAGLVGLFIIGRVAKPNPFEVSSWVKWAPLVLLGLCLVGVVRIAIPVWGTI